MGTDQHYAARLGYRSVVVGALITGCMTVIAAGVRWLPEAWLSAIRSEEILASAPVQHLAYRPFVDGVSADMVVIEEPVSRKLVRQGLGADAKLAELDHVSVCKCVVSVRNMSDAPVHYESVDFEIGASRWCPYSDSTPSKHTPEIDPNRYSIVDIGEGGLSGVRRVAINVVIPSGSQKRIPLLFYSSEIEQGQILSVFGRLAIVSHDGSETEVGFIELCIHPDGAMPSATPTGS